MIALTRRQMYAAQTRQALLDAGREAFVANGYADTAVEDLTGQTLISKGAFYRHFPDKRSLFVELFTGCLAGAADSIDRAVAEIRDAPRGHGVQIATVCAYEFSARSLHDPLHRELLRQAPEVLGDRAYQAIDDETVLPPLSRMLATLAERGELRPEVPLEITARLLLRLMCAGNTIIAAANDRDATLRDITTATLLLLSGIAMPPSGQH